MGTESTQYYKGSNTLKELVTLIHQVVVLEEQCIKMYNRVEGYKALLTDGGLSSPPDTQGTYNVGAAEPTRTLFFPDFIRQIAENLKETDSSGNAVLAVLPFAVVKRVIALASEYTQDFDKKCTNIHKGHPISRTLLLHSLDFPGRFQKEIEVANKGITTIKEERARDLLFKELGLNWLGESRRRLITPQRRLIERL